MGPQLQTSCITRTAGSISYITYLFTGVGGFAGVYFQVFAAKEHITTWLPLFVGNCFQTVILLTCAFYDFGPGRRLRGSAEDKAGNKIEQREHGGDEKGASEIRV